MNDRKTRPVKHLFRNEAVSAGVAGGSPVCRALRQIDDRRYARFLRRLRENFTVAWIKPGFTGQQKYAESTPSIAMRTVLISRRSPMTASAPRFSSAAERL